MDTPNQLPKDQWLERLKAYAIEKYQFTEEAAEEYKNGNDWDGYYNDNFSPEDAVELDMTCSHFLNGHHLF